MTSFYSILMISVFAVTLNFVARIISEVYPKATTGAMLTVVGVVFGLIAASFFCSAKRKTKLTWRLSWIAASIICFTSGWFNLADVHEEQLLKKTVETAIQLDGVRRAYPSPSTEDERIWLLKNELKAKIADVRWDYWNKMQEVSPNKREDYRWPAIYFGLGILCILSVIFAGFVMEKMQAKDWWHT